ncbi:MAG: EpsI family protein [Phycisphaerales bacterium]|nr:EpsI family protein [Phycisphaerales bacterium]
MIGGVVFGQLWADRSAPDAEAYHAKIRDIASRAPMLIGEWVGSDMPVPPAAVALLKPNVILSRKFVNFRTGSQVQFLLVQCRDARDLLGHYPPVCYVAHGWQLTKTEAQDWQIGGRMFHGTRYDFSPGTSDQTVPLVISNFMLVPGADSYRDMQGVDAAAKNHRRRLLGAAQIQVVTSERLSIAEHDAVLEMLVWAHRDLIDAIGAGASGP